LASLSFLYFLQAAEVLKAKRSLASSPFLSTLSAETPKAMGTVEVKEPASSGPGPSGVRPQSGSTQAGPKELGFDCGKQPAPLSDPDIEPIDEFVIDEVEAAGVDAESSSSSGEGELIPWS